MLVLVFLQQQYKNYKLFINRYAMNILECSSLINYNGQNLFLKFWLSSKHDQRSVSTLIKKFKKNMWIKYKNSEGQQY